MRISTVILLFGLSLLAGCVWAPDPVNVEIPVYPNIPFAVHKVYIQPLNAPERIITVVEPDWSVNVNYNTPYNDSVKYIIVNGDTTYRHPVATDLPTYDSAAPYHIDGRTNYVTMVFTSYSITDTTQESNLVDSILAPAAGSTLSRNSDGNFSYEFNTGYDYASAELQITDSSTFYDETLDNGSGTVDVPINEMVAFNSGTLWAELHVLAYSQVYYPEAIRDRTVKVDRLVAYRLQ